MLEHILLPAVLAALMFGLGLGLCVADFRRVGRRWSVVALCLCSILMLMPLIAFLLARTFGFSAAITTGFILLATCPGGMFSNVITHGSKGDLPLSLALTVCSSAIYVVAAPWILLQFFGFASDGASWIKPLATISFEIIGVVLVPLATGMWIRQKRPRWAMRYASVVHFAAVVLIGVTFIVIALQQIEQFSAAGSRIALSVLCLNLCGWLLAGLIVKLAGLSSDAFIAIGAEHSIRQEGVGAFVAITLLGRPDIVAPILTNAFVGFFVCLCAATLVRWFAKREATLVLR